MKKLGDPPPFCHFERAIAWRYLRARRKEGFISVIAGFSFLGITLGVATLIVVMAVMNGFRDELLSKILGFNGHITVLSSAPGPIIDPDPLVARLAQTPGVERVAPYIEGQVMVSSQRQATGALVRGMKESDLKKIKAINNSKLSGTFAGIDKNQGIAIGWRMAMSHGMSVGDQITLISPEGPETVLGTAPRLRSYKIVAIFNIGMSDYDNTVVYMSFQEAQDFFMSPPGASAVEVTLKDPDRTEDTIALFEKKTGGSVQFLSWKQTNQTFFTALNVERNVMFLILTLIILVAALNIVSGLIMLVKDKGHDIAILRTMGACQSTILRIFFMAGAAIGIFGTFCGITLGSLVCFYIENIRQFFAWLSGTEIFSPELYYLSTLPAKMEPSETLLIALLSLFLSFVATLYPAYRAAKLDPIEALRYE